MRINIFFKLIQLVLLGAILPLQGLAQDTTALKLKASLDTVSNNIRKIDIWIELADVIADRSVEGASLYLDSANQLAIAEDYTSGIASANKVRGSLFILEGKYSLALEKLGEAQSMFRALQDSSKLAKTFLLLGNIYSASNNFKEALRYYRNAGKLFKELNDYKSQAAINNNIGGVYWHLGKLDSASLFFNKSLLTYLEFGDQENLATNYTNIGIIYAERNEYEKAIDYYERSNDVFIKLDRTYAQSINYLNISDAYIQMGEYGKAEEFIKMSIEIAEKEGYKSLLVDEYFTVGEIREAQKKYKMALDWYKKSEALEDSLLNSDTNSALIDLQTKQLEEIQKGEIEKIKLINEGHLNSEKLKNTLLLVVSAFILVLLLVATTYFYKRAKVARQINEQNLQILNQKSKIYQQAKSIADKNEALLEKNAKLEELNEEKNYIMNVVAHDLKSPLNQIQGLVEVIRLEKGSLTSNQLECLTNISTSSERLSKMINRILNTRAIDSESIDYQAISVNLVPILHQVLNNFQPLADQKGINITMNDISNFPLVKGDKHHILQVIENIISNAIKFSPTNKKIEINVKIKDRRAVLAVKDQGPGLTAEDHKNLFIEYANLSAQPTGDETSTGLGLSIVKKYVDLMKGEIWCDSTSGQGATFYLAFNLA
ncbi:MAG: tetratricopeptide repeat protein [Cyclobacteriaceae bacterium]|nr:tetratricopeptide repeat protein [Cyclobacteriaceae bacterium]